MEISPLLLALISSFAAVYAFLVTHKDEFSKYDKPDGEYFSFVSNEHRSTTEIALEKLRKKINKATKEMQSAVLRKRILILRKVMDSFFDGLEIKSSIKRAGGDNLSSEWVLSDKANSKNRILYIHGGAFFAGSTKSHRVITDRLSQITNFSVLAINYRLIPENNRLDSLYDCMNAFHWLKKYGPKGLETAEKIVVIGDSAGGNLALALSAMLREQADCQPNAVVALSPITDSRLVNPSVKKNINSDFVLEPIMKNFTWLSKIGLGFAAKMVTRHNPFDVKVSPLLGKLNDLPPTLVQVSDSEILFDDARRYVNKAVDCGSVAKLQVWENMPHVWHIFYPELTQANDAFIEITRFIKQNA